MIPYQLDPSLHPAPPAPERLEDGFAPPQAPTHAQESTADRGAEPGPDHGKSPF